MTLVREGPPERIGRGPLVSSWAHWENVGLKGSLGLNDVDLLFPGNSVNGLELTRSIVSMAIEFSIEGVMTMTIVVRDPTGHLFATGSGHASRSSRWRPKQPTKRDPRTHKKIKAFQRNPVEVDENWDPLLSPNLLARSAQVTVDGVVFRLVKARPTWSTAEVELTFEHRITYWLKRKGGPGTKARRFDRRFVTRAEAILALLREVRAVEYRFVCPSLHDKQAIQQADPKTKRASASKSYSDPDNPVFPRNVQLAIQDAAGNRHTATSFNRRIGALALAQADRDTTEEKPRLSLMEAIMVESGVSNPVGGEGSSAGCLQLTADKLKGSKKKKGGRLDVELVVHDFLTGTGSYEGHGGAIPLAKAHPDWSAGKIAQACQGSAYPERYDKVKDAAMDWLQAWSGDASSSSDTVTQPYSYGRNEDEDNWKAIMRMAEEVGWRFFVVGNSVYYMSETELYARRPRYVVRPDDSDLIEATFDIDWGKPISTGSLTITNTDRWGTPPGCVVLLEDFGPPDGRWLVQSLTRDWFSANAELTLIQPSKAKKEPANSTNQRAQNASEPGEISTSGGAQGIVDDAVRVAKDAGGPSIYVGSALRPGSTTTGGNVSDHSQNNSSRAARDIGKRGTNLLTGPPSPELDKSILALGEAFGRDYKSATSGPFQNADTFTYRGFRVQIIWRTPKWGGHMGHIHCGARKA